MDPALIRFGATAFVMLIVVVNPVAVAPIFVAVTDGMARPERTGVLNRAVALSFGVAMFFLFVGPMLLQYLGVTVNAFAISGGLLLFVIAFRMLFGQRSTARPAEGGREDVAIFPLTIPQLVGPGTIATILVLATQARGDWTKVGVVVLAIVCVYLVSWPTLYSADWVMHKMGEGTVQVVTRVLGVVLAALAVQYVLNGVAGYVAALR